MSNINEKLEHFSKTIILKANNQKKEILDKVNEERKKVLEKKELDYLEEAYNGIQEGLRKINKQKNEMISRAVMDGKKELLNTRENIIETVFNKAQEKLIQFTKTKEYIDYLTKIIDEDLKYIGEGEIKIFISPEDKEHLPGLNEKFNGQVYINDQDDIIGGCIIYNSTQNTFLNDTLKEKLLSEKEKFIQTSKLEVD